MTSRARLPLRHLCLTEREAASTVEEGRGPLVLAEADLSDRERFGVLLQAAAVLAHLDRVGYRLAEGWRNARVDSQGRLTIGEVEPGEDPWLPQERLHRLLLELFEPDATAAASEPTLVGRSEGRRLARRLQSAWRQRLDPLRADRLIIDLLSSAPFLWRRGFGAARAALVGQVIEPRESTPWVVGGAAFRRRVLAQADSWQELVALLASDRARSLWSGSETKAPLELASTGRHRDAVAAWGESPPESVADRRSLAESLFHLGRFEECLEVLRGLRSFDDRRRRLDCRVQLGELRAARGILRRLESAGLEASQRLVLAPVAIRVMANVGDREGLERWRTWSLEAGRRSGARARAGVAAAWASWDLGEYEAMAEHLEAAEPELGRAPIDVDWAHARGLLDCSLGRPRAGAAWIREALLSAHRDGLPDFRLGRLWNDMVLARVSIGDLRGAERAASHAYRRLRRCEGRLAWTLALSNLAEVRIRRGRLRHAREILEWVERENAAAGNRRAHVQDLALQARFWLARGDTRRALEVCEEGLSALEKGDTTWHRTELETLASRALGWEGETAAAAQRLASGFDRDALEPEERPAVWLLAGERARAQHEAEALEGRALRRLWQAVVDGESVPEATLAGALARLEGYRAARLLWDLRMAGVELPARRRRWAAGRLSEVGARRQAEALEPGDGGVWRELRRLVDREPSDLAEARALLCRLAPGARLVRRRGENERVVIDGAGGVEVLRRRVGGGILELSAERLDDRARAVFALLGARWLEASQDGPEDAGAELTDLAGTEMIGDSEAMRSAIERLQRFAGHDLSILLQGETGTGKELAARLVHRRSSREGGPFQSVNCAALPNENLLLSELFGHVRGAFTGADRARAGAFESAQGGTLFLDEIGDLPPVAQGTLLRVLEEGELTRLGETRVRRVDVRVVAATHRDLRRWVDEGRFREDLFYRLAVATVRLPPLRERGGDLELLASHFAASQVGAPTLCEEALARLREHDWPGNVRELRGVVEAAAALAQGSGDGRRIEPHHLDLPESENEEGGSYHRRVDRYRRRLIEEALRRHDGNQAAAARSLGLSRQALSYWVGRFRIRPGA